MSARGFLAAATVLGACGMTLLHAQAGREPVGEPVRVRVETALGAFEVELDAARAPTTVANFLKYVDGGFYDGGRVHRSARLETQAARPVKIEVIQAGIDPSRTREAFPAITRASRVRAEWRGRSARSENNGVNQVAPRFPASCYRWPSRV